jgi:RNase H-like domain found in reverse transcriptase
MILEWKEPRTLKDFRIFLGFSIFYRRFIREYSRIVAPLCEPDQNGCAGVKFAGTNKCQDAFERLRSSFTSAPIQRHFDYEQDSVVETDASEYVSAGVLYQTDDQ